MLAHEGLEHVAAQPHAQGAESAELADMAVEMHDKRPRAGIAELGGHLMADAAALVNGTDCSRHQLRVWICSCSSAAVATGTM